MLKYSSAHPKGVFKDIFKLSIVNRDESYEPKKWGTKQYHSERLH